MDKYCQVIILCEDRQQEVFARYFLISCGIDRHRIRVRHSLKGKGAGEQYVRKEYAIEVKEYRRRCTHLNIALVVLIDADNKTVADRFDELDRSLEENLLSKRQVNERIGIFVPKRNIETWIYYLQGQTVNEIEVYPELQKEADCKSFVIQLAKNRRTPLPENAPTSMQLACNELQRIL